MYRLARREYVEPPHAPFDGMGAYYGGSRWSSPGRRASFAASSESLATLEYLVHANSNRYFHDVVLIVAEVPDSGLEVLRRPLPADWRGTPPPLSTMRLGDAWLEGKTTPALIVPSVVVPRETNVMVNPLHPEADGIRIVAVEPWTPDDRLRPGET
ncbi:MAG TPA: RES family NAD+ phosphorylase [Candidatus Elarobacter sp.]|nr:RES family NAD+ phosphorylase [Candidatus Elarobacter sp.]